MILGGGLAGLSAGYVLSKAGRDVVVLERDGAVGGLSKTIVHGGYRFDLGGHRFFTKKEEISSFVRELMTDELVTVGRSSKIFLRDRFFDYPLKPLNACFGLGIPTSARILADYGIEKFRQIVSDRPCVSLEDWVVRNFGRTMFDIYFKVYSEKVWGIECSSISAEWMDKRINGLSLAKALGYAFRKVSGRQLATLADEFLYPRLGIGRISDRLSQEITQSSKVLLDAPVERVYHDRSRIESMIVNIAGNSVEFPAHNVISSIPLTRLVQMLDPQPPASVISAASRLKFRDLVVIAVMVDRERVTDQTWIYIPEKTIPFGRIHEPTNWSPDMAPAGKTLLVIEYFSFRGDRIWREDDDELERITVENLERLGFLTGKEVIGSRVVRVPQAYPLFEVGYGELCDELYNYLDRFENLYLTGRSGMFRYYNMDHAIESGIETAQRLISAETARMGACNGQELAAGCEQ